MLKKEMRLTKNSLELIASITLGSPQRMIALQAMLNGNGWTFMKHKTKAAPSMQKKQYLFYSAQLRQRRCFFHKFVHTLESLLHTYRGMSHYTALYRETAQKVKLRFRDAYHETVSAGFVKEQKVAVASVR